MKSANGTDNPAQAAFSKMKIKDINDKIIM